MVRSNGMISPLLRLADHRETRFWAILTRLRAILVTGCAPYPLRYLLFSVGEWCSIAVCWVAAIPMFHGAGVASFRVFVRNLMRAERDTIPRR